MTPEQIAIATKRHIQGQSIYEIAPQVGRDPSTVAKTLRKPEIKALIEREAQEIINRGLKPARRTLTRLAAIGNTKSTDKDMLKLSLDASKHITSMAGLSGTTPSTVINALIQVNEAPQQHEELSTLRSYLSERWINQTITSNDGEIKQAQAIGIQAAHTPTPDAPAVINIGPGSDA